LEKTSDLPVLVTGGAGYIGSHTAKALSQAGMAPVVFDNLSTGHRRAVQWGPLVEGDLADSESLRSAIRRHGIKAVIHFAAVALVGESMEKPGLYFRTNCSGTLSLLEAMREEGVRTLVVSSSCATYGIPERLPISEAEPQHPINPYGESKVMVERMLHWYEQAHGLSWVALRYFNAAGADPDGELGEDHSPETHLIPRVILAALGLESAVSVYGTDYATEDGTAVRDYVHVTDLAEAHVSALKRLLRGEKSEAFNLGTGHGCSVKAVIAAVEKESGRAVPYQLCPRRPGDPAVLVANASKANRHLGWNPVHSSLKDIVQTAWRWHVKHCEKAYQEAV
jgi:UDP-glucose-4-epimerase GalE